MIRVATRKSALALAQTRAFVDSLRPHTGDSFEEIQIVTEGDRVQNRPLADIGGKGLFVKEIEQSLIDHRADFAVHSMKDVPATLAEGLTLGCVPKRASSADLLLVPRGRSPLLADLPSGAKVGSSSARRMRLLLVERPDLSVIALRGNIDTRLRRLDGGDFDAIVLAEAGLDRLGFSGTLPPHTRLAMLPAVGQGALAIECRGDDPVTLALLASLDDLRTRWTTACERAVLLALDADCTLPVAAHAVFEEQMMNAKAWVFTNGEHHHAEASAHCDNESDAMSLGKQLAAKLPAIRA